MPRQLGNWYLVCHDVRRLKTANHCTKLYCPLVAVLFALPSKLPAQRRTETRKMIYRLSTENQQTEFYNKTLQDSIHLDAAESRTNSVLNISPNGSRNCSPKACCKSVRSFIVITFFPCQVLGDQRKSDLISLAIRYKNSLMWWRPLHRDLI